MAERFRETFLQELIRARKEADYRLKSLLREKRTLERKIFNLVSALEEGELRFPQLRERAKALQARLEEVNAELNVMPALAGDF